jgi:hypothetical protein
MPQLPPYTQRAINGQPGQPFDAEVSLRDVVSRTCSALIPYGTLCEMDTNGLAVPVQDVGTTTTFLPNLLGISMLDPLAAEQAYVPPTVTTTLAGTVTTTNNSKTLTFSTAQTLVAGQPVVFTAQPGVVYFIATATSASTAATLTVAYSGTTHSGAGFTTSLVQAGSSSTGWAIGKVVPFLRRGRIWVASDGNGTWTRYGVINIRHSSTGANPQGVFTMTAAQTTAGNEIDIAPNCVLWNPDLIGGTTGPSFTDPFGNTYNTAIVEINA